MRWRAAGASTAPRIQWRHGAWVRPVGTLHVARRRAGLVGRVVLVGLFAGWAVYLAAMTPAPTTDEPLRHAETSWP